MRMASEEATITPGPSAAEVVEIWTDGGCKPNPGPGGWAAVMRFKGVERELSGADATTTNNRMELTAATMALEALKRPCRVVLHTEKDFFGMPRLLGYAWTRPAGLASVATS